VADVVAIYLVAMLIERAILGWTAVPIASPNATKLRPQQITVSETVTVIQKH